MTRHAMHALHAWRIRPWSETRWTNYIVDSLTTSSKKNDGCHGRSEVWRLNLELLSQQPHGKVGNEESRKLIFRNFFCMLGIWQQFKNLRTRNPNETKAHISEVNCFFVLFLTQIKHKRKTYQTRSLTSRPRRWHCRIVEVLSVTQAEEKKELDCKNMDTIRKNAIYIRIHSSMRINQTLCIWWHSSWPSRSKDIPPQTLKPQTLHQHDNTIKIVECKLKRWRAFHLYCDHQNQSVAAQFLR